MFIQRQEFTIRKWPLYFVAAVYILMLFIFYDSGKLNEPSSLILLVSLALFGLLFFMLSKNKLVIDNDEITQHLFFGKQKVIKWKTLQSSVLNWHYHGHGADLSWSFTDEEGKTINIQTTAYSRNKLKAIAEALIAKAPQAVTDKRLKEIAAGKFPWYIF